MVYFQPWSHLMSSAWPRKGDFEKEKTTVATGAPPEIFFKSSVICHVWVGPMIPGLTHSNGQNGVVHPRDLPMISPLEINHNFYICCW